MSVMTVTGPISSGSLGTVLSHEHLLIDLTNQFREFDDPEKRRISRQKVCMSNLGVLRRNPYALRDNLLLDDLELAVEEALFFKRAGGTTIVDCTSLGINRDPKKLRDMALATGLNIIAGSGCYTYDTRQAETADGIARDLTVGMDGTDIKAGVIGEIGTSAPIHPDEKKNLLEAAMAFRQVRAAIYVHTFPWARAGLEAVDILVDQGVDPAKIAICHIDVEFDMEYIKALLKKGVFVEFDNFGKEFYIDVADRDFAGGIFARDIERVQAIKELLDLGYAQQILISNDICLKCLLRHYGGWGYDHILRNVVPMMLDNGIARDTVDVLLRENPKILLSSGTD